MHTKRWQLSLRIPLLEPVDWSSCPIFLVNAPRSMIQMLADLIIGLTLSHTKADLYRAILEGIGYGIRHNIDAMRAEGVPPKRILAVGGGTKNSVMATDCQRYRRYRTICD